MWAEYAPNPRWPNFLTDDERHNPNFSGSHKAQAYLRSNSKNAMPNHDLFRGSL
jgi:hypothetical protein